jgi:hypothetical protein
MPLAWPPLAGADLAQCARVESNHHGENSPQGPQPWARGVDPSAGVQDRHSVGSCGRFGTIGRSDFCQRFVTESTAMTPRLRGARRASQSRVGGSASMATLFAAA